MPDNIQNVAIMTKVNSDEAYQTAKRVNLILQQKKINVFAISPLCDDKMTSVSVKSVKDLDIDLILAIGGDGTIDHYSWAIIFMIAGCVYKLL